MNWVTRARPKTDRIACPWLIAKFIDPDAEILYVPAAHVLSVAEEQGGHSFDALGAEYTHRGSKCSFETLIDEFDLNGNAALVRLARTHPGRHLPWQSPGHPLRRRRNLPQSNRCLPWKTKW